VKPIRDVNEVDPQDGYDVVSTIDVYIQDIAHHALLKQLQLYKADHGCVVVMETKTGYIKAISNLGRGSDKDSTYYETTNYAIAESHEPGSTYKLADLMALLEDKKVDTSAVYDSQGGIITYSGKKSAIRTKAVMGKFRLPEVLKYRRIRFWYRPFITITRTTGGIRRSSQQLWAQQTTWIAHSGRRQAVCAATVRQKSLERHFTPWMAFGYGVSITPLQTLTFYNSVANNGEMVKPQFVSEIKEWNKPSRNSTKK
jgi:cell division protein FtsI (penicillin-binding protein 3)